MGNVWSRTRSQGQIVEKPHVHCIGHSFSPIVMKLGQNICLFEISDKLKKMGHVGSKTRLLDQILKNACIHTRGHIICLILIKFGENVCLNEIFDEFENGSCWVKN